MENTPSDQSGSNDAARMSARIVALKNAPQEDGTPGSDPAPPQPPPQTWASKAVIRRRRTLLFLAGIVLFGAGGWTGAKLAKKRAITPVAIINGEPLLSNDFMHHCEIASGQRVFQQMVNDQLQVEFAKQKGVIPSPAAIEAKYIELAKQPNFMAKLRLANETTDDFKADLLIRMSKDAVVEQGVKVTDAEVQAYYKANSDRRNAQARFYHPETVTLGVIISPNEDDIRKAQRELAGGASFVDVVLRYSKDSSRAEGGVLPPIRHGQGELSKLPGVESKIFDMAYGQQLAPIQIKGAWWIIRCLAKSPESTDPFDKVTEDCRASVVLIKGYQQNGKVLQEEEAAYGRNAEINVLWPAYTGLIHRK